MDIKIREEIEAEVFQKLVKHFRKRTDVQNIDLMNTADFCRNCLSKWYMASAKKKGIKLNYEEAKEIIYGMSYDKWKKNIKNLYKINKEEFIV